MKGKRWLDLIKEEQARFSAALIPHKPLVARLEKELLGQSAKHKSFKYHDFEIKETNTLHYEFGNKGCADLDAIGSSIWYVEDEGKGAETYFLKHKSWSYDKPVGPFVAVLEDRVYVLESKHDLLYYRLVSLDAETGKDRRVLFEMKDPEWNLALIKGQNKCLFLLANNAGKQRLWYIKEGKPVEVGQQYQSFVPVGFLHNTCCFFGLRSDTQQYDAIGLRIDLDLKDLIPEYYSLQDKLFITRSYGERTIHYSNGKKRTVLGSVKPNLFLDWQGRTDLKIHESGGTRYFVKSKDGTNVPYVIIQGHRSTQGLLVIGYGAYGLPTHMTTERWLPLLRRGFTLCYALVRGGGDHDDAWAEAARRDHKVKSVEDFEAVIQSAKNKTGVNAENTVIYGRSAGGYLVGATLARNASGNLFRSLYTEVPYLDVLSTASNPSLPLTQLEYDEFGDPLHKAKNRAALLRLSPVNTIPESGAPSIFVLCRTGLNDKEVFAYESVKWITRLRENEGKPKLLAISQGEGHFVYGRSSFRERAEDLALLLSHVARRFSRDKTKKSKHRIYKMESTRRNRMTNVVSRKNRKGTNNMTGGRKGSRKNRMTNVVSRKNRKGNRKNRKDRKSRKNRKGSRKNRKNGLNM